MHPLPPKRPIRPSSGLTVPRRGCSLTSSEQEESERTDSSHPTPFWSRRRRFPPRPETTEESRLDSGAVHAVLFLGGGNIQKLRRLMVTLEDQSCFSLTGRFLQQLQFHQNESRLQDDSFLLLSFEC
ncbi:hypothetical protein FQA47_019181 [Oryzias melastigma]|uniref:Uncharacterized protein n=1 Tax=Oryzias melastigma TaxID=30732 RepID=A0A834F6C0_ORYME|nr:hypothetical protein FQA47_019181 [Oryzias melastigma]